MNKTTLLALLGAGAIVLSSGCSSDDDSPPPPPPPTQASGTVSNTGGTALDQFVTLTFTSVVDATVTVTTDANGQFVAPLEAGTYDVVATRPGYSDATDNGVVVEANKTTELEVAMTPLAANTYITSANCAVCHDSTHQTFRQTGHPYKLNKVDGAAPEYPFTDLGFVFDPSNTRRIEDTDDSDPADMWPGTDNTLSTPTAWSNLTYVIGGFHWKARFIDANGYIVTGTNVQYNYATDEMVSYHNNENDKPFNCGNCHTTGWKHTDPTANPVGQDGLDGMHGTFTEQGIGCESCHGAGATHAQTKLAADITKTATPRTAADFASDFGFGKPIACGECHTRDGERDYPTFLSAFDVALAQASKPPIPMGGRIAASGGLVKHHEQGDEILGIDPDTLDTVRSQAFMSTHGNCMTCHDTHLAVVKSGETGVTQVGVDRSNDACMQCHNAAQYDPANNSRGSMTGLNCSDCHMPKTAKSAVSTTLSNGVVVGDVTSHTFKIDINSPQMTPSGSFSYPHIGVDWACNVCHGNSTFALSPQQIQGFDYHPNSTTSPN